MIFQVVVLNIRNFVLLSVAAATIFWEIFFSVRAIGGRKFWTYNVHYTIVCVYFSLLIWFTSWYCVNSLFLQKPESNVCSLCPMYIVNQIYFFFPFLRGKNQQLLFICNYTSQLWINVNGGLHFLIFRYGFFPMLIGEMILNING